MQKTTIIIGSGDGKGYSVKDIEKALNTDCQNLEHGTAFTGKPGTQLHATDDSILKLHTSGGFDTDQIAESWGKIQFAKGRQTGLYHPTKTWFIHLDGQIWRLGSITPRMLPLHTAIKDTPPKTALSWLLNVTSKYLKHAARFNERLDEGLSNFGLCKDGNIYYLDDDFYSWDHFLSFSAMLAGWFRKYADMWLNDSLADEFGKNLAFQADRIFAGSSEADPIQMIYEHLGFQFTAGAATQRLATFREALLHQERAVEPIELTEPVVSAFAAPLPPAIMDEEEWFSDNQPIAVLADIHANLPALETVLDELPAEGIRRILVVGDIVGYGPHPAECIDALATAGAVCLRGNHDHAVGSNITPSTLLGSRMISTQWTIEHLDETRKKWLRSLPLQWHADQWLALHGAPQDPTFFNAYVYDRTAEPNLRWMIDHDIHYCFHGHSHLQGIYGLKNRASTYYKNSCPTTSRLQDFMLICPGSVGQPRCGTPGAEYAILYPDKGQLEFRRIAYNMEKTIADMKQQQLPDDLIQRLRFGQ